MELDLTWILVGLPAAFALGWIASRLDLRQMRIANRQAPRAYFKGLNYLLNEQQDQAIDAFIEAVQNDPDTSELHFALGNLFRRRGEYDRAVRVREARQRREDGRRARCGVARREHDGRRRCAVEGERELAEDGVAVDVGRHGNGRRAQPRHGEEAVPAAIDSRDGV